MANREHMARIAASLTTELASPTQVAGELDIGAAGGGSLGVARVLSLGSDGKIILADDAGPRPARRAYSCLISPAVGDRVVAAQFGDALYVLAILDRLMPDQATVSVPGATSLTVTANEIALRADRDVSLSACSVSVQAGTFSLVGRLVTLVADHLRSTARRREVVADQIAVQAQSRVAVVRDTDVLEAGTVVQSVAGITSTTATTAVLVAKEDVRFDGKRVTVG